MKSSFDEFQLSEYDHIANAHFKAIESISTYFRYYLLVMALPASVVAAVFGVASQAKNAADFVPAAFSFAGVFLVVVAFAGLCVLLQIINLKMDVVLYARGVNSIRKYFYDGHGADHANKLSMRALPQSPRFPPYLDLSFSLIAIGIAVFNTLYAALGIHFLILVSLGTSGSVYEVGFGHYGVRHTVLIAALSFVIFAGHLATYYFFSRHREYQHLRGRALGVDIDGVLNEHRQKFCEMLLVKRKKKLDPESIRVLPVHENEHLNPAISRDDERALFNDPDYWTDMPVMAGAVDAIKSLRNSLSLPVYVFTYRPWPDTTDPAGTEKALWRAAAQKMAIEAHYNWVRQCWTWLRTHLNHKVSMRYITAGWLTRAGFQFDSLLVERGNENIAYSKGKYENRFSNARRRKIRFFVEDDWSKAVKLAYICDIVFLISHPYNEPAWNDPSKHADVFMLGRLPGNVVRVKSWLEIKKIVTQLA